ncbi:class III extradiol dioxygenase subunit B-like domain-containing protein [Actinacidiphila acididurans]|uniref:Class III extradiol dioxygenase subunit B-like domain-containing protein n=1 Tax=Actinacidiphila acididurans TaxID=2784346 RepID=A0ABS2TVS2_9ACTN|nr:class III extradiol dioxygenase subunit B-like domain-containing protein [Actinacidiphila acididurans]MBM9507177.1 class III extradiol dioxygenase subunit B-like domain-containing protein [Actinacidiphila acididurans]
MLVAAAVCPCPPLLVPEVAAGAAPDLDELRAACADAVGVLAASRPDRLVVVGPATESRTGEFEQGSPGSFREFGVPLDVSLGASLGAATPASDGPASDVTGLRVLPPSLAVAGWLLRGWSGAPVYGLGVAEDLAPQACVARGQELGRADGRVALLVMGDGSACRTVKAPGYLDERAEPFDAAVAAALGAADHSALAGLDAGLAAELKAAGRAPWQILAGAAESAGLTGELLHQAVPYGVAYFVATWT